MNLVAPSILSADFSRIGEEVAAMDRSGADWIHLDVMDGHFVPQITFGAAVIRAIRPWTTRRFDAHLMISPVDAHLEDLAAAGVDSITAHVEAGTHLHRTVARIRELGLGVGVSLNPGTPIAAVEPVLDEVDLVLVMSVDPGFGGQRFLPSTLGRVRRLRELIAERRVLIEVDGGITAQNAAAVRQAGADVLVAGTSAFAGGPVQYAANLAALRGGVQDQSGHGVVASLSNP